MENELYQKEDGSNPDNGYSLGKNPEPKKSKFSKEEIMFVSFVLITLLIVYVMMAGAGEGVLLALRALGVLSLILIVVSLVREKFLKKFKKK